MTEQEIQDEVFKYIKPAENAENPGNSDGYNENELYRAIREVVINYKEKADKWDYLENKVFDISSRTNAPMTFHLSVGEVVSELLER